MKILKLVPILLTLLMVSGCASKVKQTEAQQPEATTTVKKAEIKTIYLKISHNPNVLEDGAYVNAEKELSDAIIKKIKLKIPKANVITIQKPAAGLEANVVINEFNYISGATPLFSGALSDKAKLGAKLTLRDIATNKKIRDIEFGTSSKFGEEIFGGTSSTQIESLADKIVAKIKAR